MVDFVRMRFCLAAIDRSRGCCVLRCLVQSLPARPPVDIWHGAAELFACLPMWVQDVDVYADKVQRSASGQVKLQRFATAVSSSVAEGEEIENPHRQRSRSVDTLNQKTKLFDVHSSHLAASQDGEQHADPDPDNLVPQQLKETMDFEQLQGMRNVFNTFDSDNDGIVVPSDIGVLLRKLGLISSRRMIRCIVDVVDVNGDGEIDFGEFVALMVQVKELSDLSDDESNDGDGDETPRVETDWPDKKLTQEEMDAIALRQKAMTAFKQAVTIMAFKQMTGTAEEMRDQVLKVLDTDPSLRTEWELQRLLMWLETAELDFIHQLPPTSESDVRVQVCRCLTTKRFIPGQEVVHVGDKGDCMFIVLSGQADVVEERVAEKAGMPPHIHLIVSLEVGKSFGELAIVGDESDKERTATVVAGGNKPLVCGVLTRKDYRNFILKMRIEKMEPLVDMLMRHPTTACIQRSHLLKMALVLVPVEFARHDVICAEGTAPDRVVFLTKGAADITVTRPIINKRSNQRISGRKRTIRISTLTVGAAVEMVGEHIVVNDKEPAAFTLTACTACEGFVCSRNVAKRYLGKKTEVFREIKKTVGALRDFIASRVTATEEVDKSLSALFASPGNQNAKKRGSGSGNNGSGNLRPSDYRQPAVFVPDPLDLVAAEQSEALHRTHFFSKHPRRDNPLHAPNSRYINTYRSNALAQAAAKANGEEYEAIAMRPVGDNTSAVWQENDIPVKDWLDDPYAEPPARPLVRPAEVSKASSGPEKPQAALEPEPQPEPEKFQRVSNFKRKQQAVPLTPAARYAARDKALGSPRSIAAVRSSLALDHMKGVGTAGECVMTARARLEHNYGTGLPQLYPRDRTMPLPALGPGSTKAGVMVPAVR